MSLELSDKLLFKFNDCGTSVSELSAFTIVVFVIKPIRNIDNIYQK